MSLFQNNASDPDVYYDDADFFLGDSIDLMQSDIDNGGKPEQQAFRNTTPSQPSCSRHDITRDEPVHGDRCSSVKGKSPQPSPSGIGKANNSAPTEVANINITDDGYIAFGTIRIYSREDKTYIRGRYIDDIYPGVLISLAKKKQWIKLDGLTVGTRDSVSHIRCYIIPEDVDRSHRGSTKDFRKVVRYLLDYVDLSPQTWHGDCDQNQPLQYYEAPVSEGEESLFYIFNTLKSPKPSISNFGGDVYSHQALIDTMNATIPGLKTTLYAYQQRSVAAMIAKESNPVMLEDPRKTKFMDMNGKVFYMDIHQGSLVSTLPLYTEPQGGILAETMGYGKTLICLALVLATRGHYPKVPLDRIDVIEVEPRQNIASLLSMAARTLKHEGIPWKNEFHALRKAGYYYDRPMEELRRYERAYAEPIFTPTTPNRNGKREANVLVHLCSATLVIVPPNLIMQWQTEITRHVEKDALDVLVLDGAKSDVPSWRELLGYDIILMSRVRFEQEHRDDELNQGRLQNGKRYVSPLTQLRWLRVICDEGHGFAGSSSKTHAMAMLDKMFIDRRWVVSGTPSSTLHGVEVGLSSQLQDSSDPEANQRARKSSVESSLRRRREPSIKELEAKDLERLRLIVVNFLKLQPWANLKGSADTANWKQYLAPVEIEGRRHSKPALREVLQTLIVRHRIEDIDVDLSLPPLHNRVVYLNPSYHDKLAINMFVMVLISNFVTSEREDEDYMFHPRNRKKLDLLIGNLRQATFHWVGFTEENLKDTLKVSEKYLDDNLETISDRDGVLITEAILNGERALNEPSWRAFSYFHEMGVFVKDFPEHAREAWALDSRANNPILMGTVQAREAQKFVRSRLSKAVCEDPLFGIVDVGLTAMKQARDRAEEEQKQRDKTKANDANKDKQQIGAADEPKVKNVSTASSSDKIKTTLSPMKVEMPSVTLGNVTDVCGATILGFTSSKLSYLISQVLAHSPSEKCIIFYSNNNTAFWVAEALELFNVAFLIYANTLSVQKRAEYLSKFSSDIETRVLLMDLKQAGQGLHVAAASRVYIISPIWDSAVESQAIKRAHRIGQTKPVYVETLVLRDTFEEVLITRRHDRDETSGASSMSNPSPTTATKSSISNHLLDDEVMVEYLKSIKFMKVEDNEDKIARLDQATPLFRASDGNRDNVKCLSSGEDGVVSPKRKTSLKLSDKGGVRKRVRISLFQTKPDNRAQVHG